MGYVWHITFLTKAQNIIEKGKERFQEPEVWDDCWKRHLLDMAGSVTHELTATMFVDTGPTQEQVSQYTTQRQRGHSSYTFYYNEDFIFEIIIASFLLSLPFIQCLPLYPLPTCHLFFLSQIHDLVFFDCSYIYKHRWIYNIYF